MKRQADRGQQERLLLRLAIGSANQRIYVSYPRIEVAESRPRVPSFYALDVQRAVIGSLPSIEKLTGDAEREADARLAWPAPRNASLAIDAVEHDLAALDPLLHGAEHLSLKGRARYLMELNTRLARSLRSRWSRWQSRWSPSDGICIRTDMVAAALLDHALTARPHSTSALQKFATCPYQFLLAVIHRLEPRQQPEPIEEMDPLTRGSLFHRTQAECLRELQRSTMLPLSSSNLASATTMLDRTLDLAAAEYSEELAPAIDRVWQDEVESLRADLRGWLYRMADAADDWVPIRFEYAFGLSAAKGRDPESSSAPVTLPDGFKLHGIVDLIESKVDRSALRVTDHKTGSNRTVVGMVIGGGEVLQPVLYALAVEQALSLPVLQARLSYCTARGAFSEHVVTIDKHTRRYGLDALRLINQSIEKAFLPAAPKEDACTWCDFREVCGPYEEIRVGRKDRGRLQDLVQLRTLP